MGTPIFQDIEDLNCDCIPSSHTHTHTITPSQIVSSLKRISQYNGLVEPKYITRQAVESKVGSVHGWEELLVCTGFHFISQIKKDIPATIVFPEHDDSGLQRKCLKHIEALLGTATHTPIVTSFVQHMPLATCVQSRLDPSLTNSLSCCRYPDTVLESTWSPLQTPCGGNATACMCKSISYWRNTWQGFSNPSHPQRRSDTVTCAMH